MLLGLELTIQIAILIRFVPLIDHFPDVNLPEELSASVDATSTIDIESDNQT